MRKPGFWSVFFGWFVFAVAAYVVNSLTIQNALVQRCVMASLGVDLVYFGVLLVFVLAIGQVTPPVGLCLFVACDMGKVKIEEISKEVIPYIIGLIGVALLLVFFEPLVLFLPNLAGL